MKVLLLGAAGMLGSELRRSVPSWATLECAKREDIDVCDAMQVAQHLRRIRPAVVINATGYTRVDAAEAEPARAMELNATAVRHVADASAAVGARVVHFSTDYVFSGDRRVPYRESDPTLPVNAYAVSKLAGEDALRASGAAHLIVRTQWLFGVSGQSFPLTMFQRARDNKATRVVDDQFGRPTYVADLASATWDLVQRGTEGVTHVANTGETTWYHVARRVFDAVGKGTLLTPCTTAEYPTAARRPAYSVLDTTRYDDMFGRALPDWRDALDRFLVELRTAT